MPFSASSRFPEIGWYLIYNMYREYTVEELLTTHIVDVFFLKKTDPDLWKASAAGFRAGDDGGGLSI